jgi:hypothetical protein
LLNIQPNQLQVNLVGNSELESFKIVEKIVTKLPHIPYVAIGVNVDYFMEDFDQAYSSTLFYNQSNKLFDDFRDPSEKPLFGAFLSKTFLNLRLKLDIKPITAKTFMRPSESSYLHFQCNFHKDLSTEGAKSEIEEVISRIEEYYSYSEQLIKKIN